MTSCLGKVVRSVYCVCLLLAFVNFCICPSVPFGIEGRVWDVIVLIPDHCLSIYFVIYGSQFDSHSCARRSSLETGCFL